jgi:hypothetical protein
MGRREVLELITAILLGIVSIATAFGAYQATVWARDTSDLASISQQLRSRNLTETLSTQLTLQDDSRRMFAAFALQTELVLDPTKASDVAEQQAQLLAAASPALRDAWVPWAASGFTSENIPIANPDYAVSLYATPQSLQYASFVADRMVDRLTARAQLITGAAVLFALSLFVLGVGGILQSWRAAIWLAATGTALLLIGLGLTLTVL